MTNSMNKYNKLNDPGFSSAGSISNYYPSQNMGVNALKTLFSFLSGAANTPADAGVLGAIAGGGAKAFDNISSMNYFNKLNDLYKTNQAQQNATNAYNMKIYDPQEYQNINANQSNVVLPNMDSTDWERAGKFRAGQNTNQYGYDVSASGGAIQDPKNYGTLDPAIMQQIYTDRNKRQGDISTGNLVLPELRQGYDFATQGQPQQGNKASNMPQLDYNLYGNQPIPQQDNANQTNYGDVPVYGFGVPNLENYKAGIGTYTAQSEAQKRIDDARNQAALTEIQRQKIPIYQQNADTNSFKAKIYSDSVNATNNIDQQKINIQKEYDYRANEDRIIKNTLSLLDMYSNETSKMRGLLNKTLTAASKAKNDEERNRLSGEAQALQVQINKKENEMRQIKSQVVDAGIDLSKYSSNKKQSNHQTNSTGSVKERADKYLQ